MDEHEDSARVHNIMTLKLTQFNLLLDGHLSLKIDIYTFQWILHGLNFLRVRRLLVLSFLVPWRRSDPSRYTTFKII